MNTAVITAGLGPYLRWARRMAARFDGLNPDLAPVRVVTDGDVRHLGRRLAHPMFVKFLAWRFAPVADRVLWIDADCVPLRALPPGSSWPQGDFVARSDSPGTREKAERTCPEVAGVELYFNAGVFLASRRLEPVFEELADRAHDGEIAPDPFGDQSYLNVAVGRALGRYAELPREWNWRPEWDGEPTAETRLLHACGSGGLQRVFRAWARFPKREPAPRAEV